jgi:hypothetical protein
VSTIPKWYVREDTLAGPLYFYPRPAVTERMEHAWDRPKEYRWSSQDSVVDVRGAYLVTQQPVSEFMASWDKRPEVDHYELRAMASLDSLVRSLAERAPAIASVEQYTRELCEYDSNCGECTWCSFRSKLYEPVYASPVVETEVFDVTNLVELATTPDPHPDYSWTLDSPPLAAMYPDRASHQFPGYTTGLFALTAAAVQDEMNRLDLPRVEVNAWRHSMEVSTSCRIPWDVPREWTAIQRRSQEARRLNRERQDAALFGMRWHQTLKINDRVAGETKEAAVARLLEKVAENVALLVPPHTEACGTCSGMGYTK